MANYGTFGDTALPPGLDTLVHGELASGEQLLWVGQPRPRRLVVSSLPVLVFGIPWTAFSVFWVAMASGMLIAAPANNAGAPRGFGAFFSCFPLFGVPFVLIGLGMLSAPYWAYRKARRTCYALTDRRAVIWEPSAFGAVSVRSYRPADLTRVRRNQYTDGSGDLIFEEYYTYGNRGSRTTNYRGFLGIERVREIEELLRKALPGGKADG